MLKFNQRTLYFKDTDSIDSNIKKLNNNISEIHTDIHSLVNQKIDTFFGVTYDTVFTVLFTILIFLIGVIIDRWNRRNIEKKELNKLKNYFNSQFEELKTSIIPGLIKAYRKSYQEIITLDNGLQTTPPKILTKTYDRLANLESPLLFKTFNNIILFR